MYDPLPPLDSLNIYERPTLPSASRLLPDTSSPLSMFFQSLLPNFNFKNARFVPPEVLAGERAGRNDDDQAAALNDEVLINEMRLIDAINNGKWLHCFSESTAQDINLLFLIDAEDGDANQPFIELRNSLTSVVDAMRNFLTTIRVPELGNEADEDENESTDDGANDNYLT